MLSIFNDLLEHTQAFIYDITRVIAWKSKKTQYVRSGFMNITYEKNGNTNSSTHEVLTKKYA